MSRTTPRATARTFLRAHWRYLVMLNYEVAPELLAPLVPAGTTLDRWDGRTYVSVVGFRFLHTRVLGVPAPLHQAFDEINLRFYVRRELPGGEVRRGVTFVRELVARRAVALLARLAYNEPYATVAMRSRVPRTLVAEPGALEYTWRSRAHSGRVAATTVGAPEVPPLDSEATFITEHYWGYTRQRDGSTVEYRVAHPRWRVWRAVEAMLETDVAAVYGAPFAGALAGAPASAFVAEGSEVTVFAPQRLAPGGGEPASIGFGAV